MTTLETYRCDICGKDFDNDIDCYEHEIFHSIQELYDTGVKFYADGKLMPIDDYNGIENFLNDVDAIDAPTVESAELVDSIFKHEGYSRPYDGSELCGRVYYGGDGDWVHVPTHLREIMGYFGEE